MLARTKPAWYAHCWMFCISQLECPLLVQVLSWNAHLLNWLILAKTPVYANFLAYFYWLVCHVPRRHKSRCSEITRLVGWHARRMTSISLSDFRWLSFSSSLSFSIRDDHTGVADCVCSDPE